MRPTEEIIRKASCEADISIEKMATAFLPRIATASAIFTENAVLPIEGRAATMIKSEGCRPEVSSSRSEKPVETPVSWPLFSKRSDRMRNASLTASRIDTVSFLPRAPDSAILNTACSARSSTSCTPMPSG